MKFCGVIMKKPWGLFTCSDERVLGNIFLKIIRFVKENFFKNLTIQFDKPNQLAPEQIPEPSNRLNNSIHAIMERQTTKVSL